MALSLILSNSQDNKGFKTSEETTTMAQILSRVESEFNLQITSIKVEQFDHSKQNLSLPPQDISDIESIYDRLNQLNQKLNTFTQQPVIGDVHLGNILFDNIDEQNIIALSEWNYLKPNYKMRDWMHSITHTGAIGYNTDNLLLNVNLLLQGYLRVNGAPITQNEFDNFLNFNLLHVFYYAHHFAMALNNRDSLGPSEIDKAHTRLSTFIQDALEYFRQTRNGFTIKGEPLQYDSNPQTMIARLNEAAQELLATQA